MAERRMFSKQIIDSDAFVSMPIEAQCLYFHLGVSSTKDGMVNNLQSTCRALNIDRSFVDHLISRGLIERIDEHSYRISGWEENSGIAEVARKRLTHRYRTWRLQVLRRDEFTCQSCGAMLKILHVHHIKPFSTHIDLRYDTENGITLCPTCHLEVHGGCWHG